MPTVSALPVDAFDPLADLRRRFVDRARQRIAALGDAIVSDQPDSEAIAALAHQLAGSAGTFGYAKLSRAAAALEDAVQAAGGTSGKIDPSRLQPHFLALKMAFAEIDTSAARQPPSADCTTIAATLLEGLAHWRG